LGGGIRGGRFAGPGLGGAELPKKGGNVFSPIEKEKKKPGPGGGGGKNGEDLPYNTRGKQMS